MKKKHKELIQVAIVFVLLFTILSRPNTANSLEMQEITDQRDEVEEQPVEEPKEENENIEDAKIVEKRNTIYDSGVAYVSDWVGFIEAFSNTAIDTIEILDDFEVPINFTADIPRSVLVGRSTQTNGGMAFANLNASNISRKLDINGNGHQIDFGAVSLGTNQATHNEQSPWDVTFNDLDVYSGNWWGFFQTVDLSVSQHLQSKITFNNLNSYGNQMTAPFYTDLYISGTVTNHITSTYTSKFRTNWSGNTDQSVNLEVRNLIIKENAELHVSSHNGGNILVGLGGRSASLILEKNATINMVSRGTVAGSNANGRGASIDIFNGDIIMDESSTINIDTNRSYSAINFRNANSSLIMGNNATIDITSTDHTSSTDGQFRSLIHMPNNSELVIGEGASLLINATNRAAASSNIIHFAGSGKLQVGKDAILDISSDSTAAAQALVYFALAESSIVFDDSVERVNLQRTTAVVPATTTFGLINMVRGGVLNAEFQSIKQWDRDNISEIPLYDWESVSNLQVSYVGTATTINHFSSYFPAVNSSFETSFSTQNVQRILFGNIPDIHVTIDPLSENRNQDNSHIITGTTTPGSFVQFTGDTAIPEATISVDGSEIKYHVQADETGNYVFELPQNSYFTAGNTVLSTAFRGGREAATSTVVAFNIIGTVTVNYHDRDGEILEDAIELSGIVGDSYTTIPIIMEGWEVMEIPDNAAGLFTEAPIMVTYIYEKIPSGPLNPVDPLNPDIEVNPENPPILPEIQELISIDFVSQFDFDSRNISVKNQDYYANPQRLLDENGMVLENENRPNYIQISDRRVSSSGWELTVSQIHQFQEEGGHELKGARLVLQHAEAVNALGNQQPSHVKSNTILIPGQKHSLIAAMTGEGKGTWVYRLGNENNASEGVKLEVPSTANPLQTRYRTTLNWELSMTPANE